MLFETACGAASAAGSRSQADDPPKLDAPLCKPALLLAALPAACAAAVPASPALPFAAADLAAGLAGAGRELGAAIAAVSLRCRLRAAAAAAEAAAAPLDRAAAAAAGPASSSLSPADAKDWTMAQPDAI